MSAETTNATQATGPAASDETANDAPLIPGDGVTERDGGGEGGVTGVPGVASAPRSRRVEVAAETEEVSP
jgi:hypothetical protein